MPLPPPRPGRRTEVRNRPVTFSMWPARRGRRHYALQSHLFARDPWLVIARLVELQTQSARRPEALACLQQAQDFFVAATSTNIIAARPLALYYSLVNLAKVFCLTRGAR